MHFDSGRKSTRQHRWTNSLFIGRRVRAYSSARSEQPRRRGHRVGGGNDYKSAKQSRKSRERPKEPSHFTRQRWCRLVHGQRIQLYEYPTRQSPIAGFSALRIWSVVRFDKASVSVLASKSSISGPSEFDCASVPIMFRNL